MKLPYAMLLDYVTTTLSLSEIGDLLTMAGFELEGLEDVEGLPVLDVKVMANRGDGLSALGLAREVLAKDSASQPTELYRRAEARFPRSDDNAGPTPGLVTVESAGCTRYAAKLLKNVTNGASPKWLAQRLNAAGMRPISLLVDLANYVMLELGQPLHAFDRDQLEGHRIVVRQAQAGERLVTLNGEERELRPHDLVIADAVRPVALAGVMGGATSEVSASTTQVLLESAHFVNTVIRKTRRELNFNTESSYRFERSVDPSGVVAALNRFVELYVVATGDEAALVPGVTDSWPGPMTMPVVALRADRVGPTMGISVTLDEVRTDLERLGFGVEGTGQPFQVQVPSWRMDITREIDLIEEVGRVHGYERIGECLPQGTTPIGGIRGVPAITDHAREALLRAGFDQVINHSLRDRHPLDFHEDWRVRVRNPHSPEIAYLRDSLLPGLADSARRNGARNLHLFETGRVFLQGEYQTDESPEVSFLSTGELFPAHWSGGTAAKADFYSAKGVVEAIATAIGIHVVFDHPRDPDPRFHPTRQAGVLTDGGRLWIGTVGQIHPDKANVLDLPEETYMAELDLLVFAAQPPLDPQLRQFSRNPAVRRDLAFVIDRSIPFVNLESAVSDAAGNDLERYWLFDVYEGKGIPEGKHSLGLALQLRRMGSNLTDDDANQVRDRVVKAIEALGGQLR